MADFTQISTLPKITTLPPPPTTPSNPPPNQGPQDTYISIHAQPKTVAADSTTIPPEALAARIDLALANLDNYTQANTPENIPLYKRPGAKTIGENLKSGIRFDYELAKKELGEGHLKSAQFAYEEGQKKQLAFADDFQSYLTGSKGADQVTSVGMDFLPGVGTVKGIQEAAQGKDQFTGEPLSIGDRIFSGIGAIPLVGGTLKVVGKGVKNAQKAEDLAAAAKKISKFEISKTKYPHHSTTVEKAIDNGAPTTLTRGAGKRAAKQNRFAAQKEIRKEKGPPPKGFDYDEYPYASTQEGGKGAHVEPIPSQENRAAGRELGEFYKENEIKEGDRFNVILTE